MLKELIYTGLGASVVLREKIEEELEVLEKKGKLNKSDAKEFLKSLEKKGKKEDKKFKKKMKSLVHEIIDELDLVTKKDLEKILKEQKES